ncbi:hypothetical protein SLE2022_384310 [Rubroshorea leprosula]
MKGGKDEEKVMSPMFPRLHVNDTEKGGPRAPPRNKMALYEQFSIPSQRFGSGSVSMLPLPPNKGSSLVPSKSSSNGGSHERNVLTPVYNSPEPSNLVEKFHSFSSAGVKVNTIRGNNEWKAVKDKEYHQGSDVTGAVPAICKYGPLQPYNFSNFKIFSSMKIGLKADIRVPTSDQSGIGPHCCNIQQSKDQENISKSNSALELQTVNKKQTKELDSIDLKSRRDGRNQTKENARFSQNSHDVDESSGSIHSTGDKILAAASSDLATKFKNSESLKRPRSQEAKSSSEHNLNSLDGTNVQLHNEDMVIQDKMIFREDAFKGRSESCFRPSLGADNGSRNGLKNRSKDHEEKNGSVQGRCVDRDDLFSDASVEPISPDAVVGLIGEKQFWKVRRAIVRQQRVFAVQVFELHRLLKVQKLIAGSPDVLLEDTLYVGKPSLDVSPIKKLRSPEPLLIVKDDAQKQNPIIECADENAVAKIPLRSVNTDTSSRLVTPQVNYGACSGNAPSTPVATNGRPSPWCFSPPGNQWLVPVMSPSEGLIYKPYTGPCPPSTGFMAPVYGSCGQMAPGSGDFLSSAYGVPVSHQEGIGIFPGNAPLGQTYFPHYGMPVMNPSISVSAIEEVSPFTRVQSKDNQLSIGDTNFPIPHQSSCNMSSQMSQAIPHCASRLPTSKESEMQGSTASTPSERVKGDVLPLFPMEPASPESDQHTQTSEQKTQVIKVVPHNPRLATEFAARIFQSIQEERRQYD